VGRFILASVSIFFMIAAMVAPYQFVYAGQSSTISIQPQVTYTFGNHLAIQASLSALTGTARIKSGKIFLQTQGSSKTNEADIILERIDQSSQRWQLSYEQDLGQHPLRAFTNLKYWFAFLLDDGSIITSQIFSFYYEDNRYTWHTSKATPFLFHWYEGSTQLDQEVFNTAWDGVTRAKSILPLDLPQDINIYAYTSAREVQSTLQMGTTNWAAGHADPDLKMIVVSLPTGAGQRQEMARQIPHELMHILLYQKVGERYRNLPVWFAEGLASMTELYPDPDYPLLLQTAQEGNSLISIQSLCDPFPQETSGALLAYAESTSFVRFLHGQYGSSGLEKLLRGYADGQDCERGVETAFGMTLSDLESRWHRDIFESKPILQEMGELAPWLVVFFLVLLIPLMVGIIGGTTGRRAMAHD